MGHGIGRHREDSDGAVSGMHTDIRVQTSCYEEVPGEKVKMLRVVTLESITVG